MKIVTGCFYVLFTVYVYDNDFMGTNSIKVKVPIQSNKGKPSVTMIKCVTLTHNIIKDKECPNANVKLALFTSLLNLFFTRTHPTQRLSVQLLLQRRIISAQFCACVSSVNKEAVTAEIYFHFITTGTWTLKYLFYV